MVETPGYPIERIVYESLWEKANAFGRGEQVRQGDIPSAEEESGWKNGEVRALLSVLGQDFLKPVAKLTAPPPFELLTCTIKKVKATGRPTEEGFLVLKGSEAVLKERPSVKNYPYPSALRSQLLSEGTLTEKADRLVFVRDFEFSSPSAAASAIHGGSANGLIAWKNERGVTLKELEQVDGACRP